VVLYSRAPVRIDFAGAWTDVSFFADAFGGATLNAAIGVHVTGRLEVNEELAEGFAAAVAEEESSRGFRIPSPAALAVSYGCTIPAGSGLGTSATLNVVWLALARRDDITCLEDRLHIANLAYEIEKTLGILGGKQDQYASAVGGINLFEFREEGVTCQPLTLAAARVAELESRLVLCYTGKARLSSNIHRNVWGNFRGGNETTLRSLFDLRRSAYEAREALEAGDLQKFADLVTCQRHYMAGLDASTSNAQIEGLFELVAPDIMGGKPCGAGGGGCLFFIAHDAAAKARVREKLASQGLEALDVVFDFEGLVLKAE
jgi:D-glycero-alpha-D-manno-heptose-7-phosphate kinase